MATQQKKKRRYYKNSLNDRSIYYLKKATRKGASEYDFQFAMGFIDTIDGRRNNNKELVNSDGYISGQIRGGNALEIAKRVKF